MRLITGHRPSRKRGGRPGPPPRYPKYKESYADPENWKYPVHTPQHAMAARRYFNRESNRQVYDEEEQLYVDSMINRALRSFGIDPEPLAGTDTEIATRGPFVEEPPPNIKSASMTECLEYLLGGPRLRRARSIGDKELRIQRHDRRQLNARIRTYNVRIDFKQKVIEHDCADWGRRKTGKKLCKHLGKIMLTIPEEKAILLLRDIIEKPNSWQLS
jgi:hypothetical protein